MALSKERKEATVKEFGKSGKDTGSPEVQIALLTRRIESLTEHIKANGQDKRASRSLLYMVGKRKKLLNYLRKSDIERYSKLIAELGLRK